MESAYRRWTEQSNGPYPPPTEVVNEALTKIQPNGAVLIFDEELNDWFAWKPHEPIAVNNLPDDVYASHLLDVARSIAGECVNIARWPNEVERRLEGLAHFLTAYQHDPTFIEEAASLVQLDHKGRLQQPHLPLDYQPHRTPSNG